jgi:YD repeat-containing protein
MLMKHGSIEVVACFLGVVTVIQVSSAATTDYQYDALGRLTTVSQGTSQTTYVYDAAGNRSTKQVSSIVPTSIALASPTTAIEHQGSVTLEVNVGNSSATGTVQFYLGATWIGSSSVINGVADIEFMGLPVGPHAVTVAYSGGGSLTANSATVTIRVVNIDWLPSVLQILLQ